MTSKHSSTPFGEPGRLIISVVPRMPQTPRESIANGCNVAVSRRIVSDNPGASRSITASVASGVLSRGPKPVPPVVIRRLIFSLSASVRSVSRRSLRSSETIMRSAVSAFIEESNVASLSPERSSAADRVSLTVIIAAWIFIILRRPLLRSPHACFAVFRTLRSAGRRQRPESFPKATLYPVLLQI